MQQRVICRLLLATLLLQATLVVSVSRGSQQESTDANVQPIPKHGTPEFLAYKLIRVREMEGMLQVAVVGRNGQLSESAIESFLQIFAFPADVFDFNGDTGTALSIRAEAIRRLRQMPPALQRTWSQSAANTAKGQLAAAIASGNPDWLLEVARSFPLTEPGISAASLSMTIQCLKGGQQEVQQQLAQLESDCSGTIHESFQRQQCEALKAHLQLAPSTVLSPAILSLTTSPEKGDLSPPWPKPKWQWEESIASFPDAPQPAARQQMEPFLPELARNQGEFSNWRPVFWNDSIVLRSPFRLIAFDRLTGKEQWSLPTSTFTPEPETPSDSIAEGDLGNSMRHAGADADSTLAGAAAFGLLACDEEFMYFLDQFDFFRSHYPFGDIHRRRIPGNPVIMNLAEDDSLAPRKTATRLVALRKSAKGGLPHVAWIVGEQGGFPYKAITPETSINSLRDEVNRKQSAAATGSAEPFGKAEVVRMSDQTDDKQDQLKGHRFLCPPVGRGQQLFVLSVEKDQYWLSCLGRSDGRLIWQQPLIFSDEQQSMFAESSDEAARTSVCLISGPMVVCSLADGVLVGIRATDGQLQWATAVQDQPATPAFNGFQMPVDDIEEAIESRAVSLPVADQSMVVCVHSRSNNVVGIDTTSGEIQWQTSRRAFGPGEIGGSPDHYIAGINDGQIILIGERHCRSLNLKTGDQNWVVPIQHAIGRAECRGDRCLIPQQDGTLLTLNTTTGSIVQRRSGFLPEDDAIHFGAITSDHDVLCASTPVSLAVFSRADALLRSSISEETLTEKNADQVMLRVRAHLINGDVDAAYKLLKSAALSSTASPQPEFTTQFEHALGELTLQQWGDQAEASLVASDSRKLREMLDSENVQLLPRLNLTTDQQLRAAMLTFMSRQDQELSKDDLQELVQLSGWSKPQAIAENWRVRADVLFNRSASSLNVARTATESLSNHRLRELANDVVLFPSLLETDSQRQQFVNRLISVGEFAAAEAVLTTWKKMTSSLQPDGVLTQLRELDVIPGYVLGEVRQHFQPDDASDTGNVSPGLTSSIQEPLDYEVESFFRLPSLDARETERGMHLHCLPDWVSLRFSLVEGDPSEPPVVISMDMTDGTIRDRVVLPVGFTRNTVNHQQLDNSRDTPGLIAIAGTDQLAMISCVIPGKAQTLWCRRFRQSLSDPGRVEFGPLGADHFVWHFGYELHCSHSLTGQDLWIRQLNLSEAEDSAKNVRRIFGDAQVTVVMGTDGESFERFRTRDGQQLGNGRLAIGKLGETEAIGRCLLYADETARLHLFDGASGKDELADDEPIVVSRTNSQRSFQVLSNGLVVTVSAAFEVILIDTNRGKVVFRTPAASYLNTGIVLGMTAFERDGQLFVGLDDEHDITRRMFRNNFRGVDPRLGFGPLLCLDPVSGKVLWNTRVNSAVIPVVYGDPTDLLVAWSHRRDETVIEREDRDETLEILLINRKTGELVSKSESLAISRPIRCVHTAAKNTIELFTRDSIISIHPNAPASRTE